MSDEMKEVIRVDPNGAVSIFGKHAGENQDLFHYLVTNVVGRTPHPVDSFDIKLSSMPPALPPKALRPGEFHIGSSGPHGVRFIIDNKVWIELQHDHINVMGQREDDPAKVLGALVEWMNATKALASKCGANPLLVRR